MLAFLEKMVLLTMKIESLVVIVIRTSLKKKIISLKHSKLLEAGKSPLCSSLKFLHPRSGPYHIRSLLQVTFQLRDD